jgi:hypothetical protein
MGLSHMVKITFQQSLVAFQILSLLIIKAFSKPQKARFYPQVLKYSILPAKRSPTFSLASDEHSPTFSMVSEDGYALTVSVMPAQNPSMATGSHPSSATLISLPNETLLEIADFIQSPNNLSGLVRTNRFFYRLLKGRLYRLPPALMRLRIVSCATTPRPSNVSSATACVSILRFPYIHGRALCQLPVPINSKYVLWSWLPICRENTRL